MEKKTSGRKNGRTGSGPEGRRPVLLKEIDAEKDPRFDTGFSEFSRVLGGGVVPGSLVLVGGDPGIGKSTLLLQLALNLADAGKKVLYISGEESLRQIRLRADRIGQTEGPLSFLSETNMGRITELLEEEKPEGLCVAFDLPAPTFRHREYAGYKATRRPMPEELAVQLG